MSESARCSKSTASTRITARATSYAASRSRSRPARSSRCSVSTAPARRRRCAASSASLRRAPVRSNSRELRREGMPTTASRNGHRLCPRRPLNVCGADDARRRCSSRNGVGNKDGWTIDRASSAFQSSSNCGRENRASFPAGNKKCSRSVGPSSGIPTYCWSTSRRRAGSDHRRRGLQNDRGIADHGVSILLVEQNALMALKASQRAYVIDDGRIVYEGAAVDLRADRARVRDLMGLATA